MPGTSPVVVVGAGHAGVQAADSLRDCGFDDDVILIDAGPDLPYQRPPLSKEFLAQDEASPILPLRGEAFYPQRDVTLVRGSAVHSIDRYRRAVVLADGRRYDYGHLVLATGTSSRPLAVPGADLDGVLVLRTLADAVRLRHGMSAAASAVVIGAGFIGLEFAAVAIARGITVTVVETQDRPMKRALTPEMSSWFSAALERTGVRVEYGRGLAAIEGVDGAVTGVRLDDGQVVKADLVLAGIGVAPRVELAFGCGLEVDNGIVVDSELTTADPLISAIGDCANFPGHDLTLPRMRLESVQNATDQARFLAARLTGRAPGEGYQEPPWFWTHQGGRRLNIAGLARPGLDVLRRGDSEAAFSLFGFDGDELVCVESLNVMGDHMAARRAFASGRRPSRSQVADPGFDFRAFTRSTAAR